MSRFFFGRSRSDDHNPTKPEACKPSRSNRSTESPTVPQAQAAEKPQSPLAELVFIIDSSGSMQPLTQDTIGGYNSVLQKAAEAGNKALVTTVFFNQQQSLVHDRKPIGQVRPLTPSNYCASGTTALLDAVGDVIERIDLIQSHQPAGYRPATTTICIITDGLENASHRFSYPQVKKLISQHKELGWEFLFLGANIDVAEQAESLGIDPNRAAAYDADSTGTFAAFQSFGAAAAQACSGAPLDDSWRSAVDRDQIRRGKRPVSRP